jgi:hypothetical protein
MDADTLLKDVLARMADGPDLKRRFDALVVAEAGNRPAVLAKARAALTVAGYDDEPCDTVRALAEVVRLAGACLYAGV